MKPSICFPAADIRTEGIAVDVELSTSWLTLQLAEAGLSVPAGEGPAGTLKGRLSRSGGGDIVVRGRVRTAVQLPCVRCLEPAAVRIDAEMSLLLQPRSGSAATRRGKGRKDTDGEDGEYEFSASEADLDVYDGETVVLDDFVRELILLETPGFPLCREDCPGLGSGHRAVSHLLEEQRAAEVDPRLAPLGAFRQGSEGERPVTVDDLVQAAAARSGAVAGRKPILKSNRKGPSRRRKSKK